MDWASISGNARGLGTRNPRHSQQLQWTAGCFHQSPRVHVQTRQAEGVSDDPSRQIRNGRPRLNPTNPNRYASRVLGSITNGSDFKHSPGNRDRLTRDQRPRLALAEGVSFN